MVLHVLLKPMIMSCDRFFLLVHRFAGAPGASRAEAKNQQLFALDDRALRNLDAGEQLPVEAEHPFALSAEKMGMISGAAVQKGLVQAKPNGAVHPLNLVNDLRVGKSRKYPIERHSVRFTPQGGEVFKNRRMGQGLLLFEKELQHLQAQICYLHTFLA